MPIVELVIGAETVPAVVYSRGSAWPSRQHLPSDPLAGTTWSSARRTISAEFELRVVQLAEYVRLGSYRIVQLFVVLHPGFPVGNVGGLCSVSSS